MANSRAPGGQEPLYEWRRGKPRSWLGLDHADLDTLAENFEGRRYPTALAVYVAVLRVEAEAQPERTRKEMAALAGVSIRALDEYTGDLERLAMIVVVRRRDGDLSLPNVYSSPPDGEGGAAESTGAADDPHLQSSFLPNEAEGGEKNDDGGGLPTLPLGAAPPEMAADAVALLKRKTRVDGRAVSSDEMAKAAAALATFNREAGREYGLGPHLKSLVMRIRERPSMDPEKHVRLVESAFRVKWWERNGRGTGRRLTPSVIYGNERVFEQVIQDAVDEQKGTKPEQRKGRFDRDVVRDG